MTTCERQAGFTLIEVVVVLGVLGLLLGSAMPLASAVIVNKRRTEAQQELDTLASALDSYYFEHASFPATLTATDFFGVHLQPGFASTATVDAFGQNVSYIYAVNAAQNFATVHSIGENGRNDGFAREQLGVQVFGGVPGSRKTWMKLRIAIEVLANHIESGGSIVGTWPTVRTAIGLGSIYDQDGFGVVLSWNETAHTLSSAGPDRTFGTADDITI